MPFGVLPIVTGAPMQPMHQFSAPGGCCTSRKGELTFHATAQPISHPWPDPGVRVELLLNARSNLAPAGIQWEFRLPSGLQIVEIEEGNAAKKAGKTLVCNGAKCLLYGLNRATIPNGLIAVAKIRVAQGLDGTKGSAQFGYQPQSRNRKQEIQVVDAVAASLEGKPIKVVSGSGATNANTP
jgi:hypothetical protein